MRYLYLFIALILPLASFAQLSPTSYRMQVLNYSLELKKMENSSISSAEELSKIKTLRLPTLSLSGSFDYNMRRLEGQKHWVFAVQPQLTQTIYGGGSVNAEIETYELKREIAFCDVDYTLLEVLYAADYAYWSLLSTRRYRDAMSEYIKIIKSLKEVIDRRFSEGYIPKGDLLMMATRLSEATYNLVSAEQSYMVALHNFNILRGGESEDIVEIPTFDVKGILPPQRVSLAEVLERRPDYEASLLGVDVYKVSMRSTRATYNPSLKAGVGASWAPYTPNYSGKTRVDGSAFLQLSATLFHFGERRKALSVAYASYVESEITKSILYDAIELEESDGWTTIVDRYAQMRSASESLEIASENLEISTYSYKEGQTTILDVMQAQISWIQIYTNAINAEFNYMVAISNYGKITATSR